jgi:dTDP-4-dehydrorhamnose reductase
MRVLVTGAAGQVGSEIVKAAPPSAIVFAFDSEQLDINNSVLLNEIVEGCAPDIIINAAAYTNVDKAEQDPGCAYSVNEKAVKNLVKVANARDILLLHISTDYVFDGESSKPYTEIDTEKPLGVYGASKLAGEKAIIKACEKYFILRTSWVFGGAKSNFVTTMLRLSKDHDVLRIVSDQYGCPTSTQSIAAALWTMADRYISGHSLDFGVYNYCGAPCTTWYDFANTIFNIAHKTGLISSKPKVVPIKSKEYPTLAQRPKYSVLNCEKIKENIGIEQPSWMKDLEYMLTK